METTELYQLIGQITCSFTKIDFLISTIAEEIGFVENRMDFFADNNFKKKIERFAPSSSRLISNIEIAKELKEWLIEIDHLRIERNKWMHSMILVNAGNNEEFRLSNSRRNGMDIIHQHYNHSAQELRTLSNSFIDSYNRGFFIFEKIDDYINSKNATSPYLST